MSSIEMTAQQKLEIEAAAFRKMVAHFQKYPEVQNIELMNLAYFCRNCLSKWVRSAAEDNDVDMDYDQARELVYGMPYSEYKSTFLEKATEEQLDQFKEAQEKAT